MKSVLIVFAFLLQQDSSGKLDVRDDWRTDNRCGTNCVYAFLKLLGKAPSYEEIYNRTSSITKGSSIADVADALNASGANVVVVRRKPNELRFLQMPFVAHIEHDNPSVLDFNQRGHFVVVLNWNPHQVSLLDGTSGSLEFLEREYFERCATGYAIVSIVSSWYDFLAACIGFVIALCIWRLLKSLIRIPRMGTGV